MHNSVPIDSQSNPKRPKNSHQISPNPSLNSLNSNSISHNSNSISADLNLISPKLNFSTLVLLPEIILEILSRLPVRSLLRFRSVCKSWAELIYEPRFVKQHLNLCVRNLNYAHHVFVFTSVPKFSVKSCPLSPVLSDSVIEAVEMDYPLREPHKSVWIVGSCNGLVCVAIEEDMLFLWNPTTRVSNELPNPGVKMLRGRYLIYGFGWVEGIDDYKVVGVFGYFGDGGFYDCEVKVFSLRAGCWKRIQDFPNGVPLDDSGKFVNGSLHWAASRDVRSGSCYSWTIVSLDLANETYGEVLQPSYDEGDKDLTLGVWGEWLCVLCNYPLIRADVWVMKEYGLRESWCKLVSIPYLTDPGRCQYSAPIFISRNGEILLEFDSRLVLYDSKKNSFKHPEIHNFDICLEATTYVESLVSPYVNNGPEMHQ